MATRKVVIYCSVAILPAIFSMGFLVRPVPGKNGSLDRLARRHIGKQFNIIGILADDYGNEAATCLYKSKR